MLETATLANGCFWCTEAIFQRLRGVEKVVPGYAGGHVKQPSYEKVSVGTTGHAEAIQIEFDPAVISYEKILQIFWRTHDPTTLNKQGHDEGPQYRSAIFYHTKTQKAAAEKTKAEIEKEGLYTNPIVTEITPFTNFYEAEDYHHNYFNNNQPAAYCNLVISPKVNKLIKDYSQDLKLEYQKK